MSAKLVEKRMYYTKVTEEITAQLKEQQGKNKGDGRLCETKDSREDLVKNLKDNLDAAKVKFDQLTKEKSRLIYENTKVKESVSLFNCKINESKGELREMDEKSLEEELHALLSDKAGETEFMQSLQLQISKLKEISDLVKCSCGEEFKVELDMCLSNREVQEELN